MRGEGFGVQPRCQRQAGVGYARNPCGCWDTDVGCFAGFSTESFKVWPRDGGEVAGAGSALCILNQHGAGAVATCHSTVCETVAFECAQHSRGRGLGEQRALDHRCERDRVVAFHQAT